MSARSGRLPDGVLLLDKPGGCTSFDVVRRVQRLARPGRVGHTGTLDPMATGLLVLVLGEATKLAPWLSGSDKRYLARLRLGRATDTLDAEGRVVEELPVPPLDDARVEGALAGFRGEIEQRPPMFSALHHQGRRLHELAREGQDVERAPRRVRIHELRLVGREPDLLVLDVRCSAGTYVRSLGDDLARALGTCGHLVALVRTEACGFRLEQAMTPDAWEALPDPERAGRILPPEAALHGFRRIQVPPTLADRLACGQRLGRADLDPVAGPSPEQAEIVWFHGVERGLVALAELQPAGQDQAMKLLRVLAVQQKNIDSMG
ncbi:MAG TPA: tRNA pseudouridine(55) synthase TruB [Myxococcota bacterium]|nr:tRNA pseudouridine(55) synthase TruB [Myxococcota bacterium]HRY92318.1 tRNA pseudouridine(55) synthase TruB [Myxococcota bacterium]HSA23243.1 tRNA pseudouridine(55) synthase TruB [Myxococcota bacterium]